MRLFIAAELGASITRGAERLIGRLKEHAPEAKWVKPENAHLTLAFLGEAPEERVPQIRAVLSEVASRHPPLDLAAEGGGAFGAPLRPRVLWVGIGGQVAALSAVQADLQQALRPLGFEPEERRFHAHLTLARSRDPRGDPGLAGCVEPLTKVAVGEARVAQLVLFQSQLTPAGPRYTPLFSAPLSQAPGSQPRSRS